jgi:hypothetical protein
MKKSDTNTIDAQLAGYDKAARKAYGLPDSSTDIITDSSPEILSPESMLPGAPVPALSPLQASAIAAVSTCESETAVIISRVKEFERASTAGKVLAGINLRHLHAHYVGDRNPKGGRPRRKPDANGFTWPSYLIERFGISDETASRWMKMADAVESIAELEGLDLRTICEKLPWNWTPEESALIDVTVHALCEDKTQRELLQADFLAMLGYKAPEKPNSSNNPFGKNGGKKRPAANRAELLRERQEAARLILMGTITPGRVEQGSVAMFMENFINTAGADLEALPKIEMKDFYENTLMPFADLIRKMIK